MTGAWQGVGPGISRYVVDGRAVGLVEYGTDYHWHAKAHGASLGPFMSERAACRAVELNATLTPGTPRKSA